MRRQQAVLFVASDTRAYAPPALGKYQHRPLDWCVAGMPRLAKTSNLTNHLDLVALVARRILPLRLSSA
jgi:hypothetical protein